jgi:hypothetical protein
MSRIAHHTRGSPTTRGNSRITPKARAVPEPSSICTAATRTRKSTGRSNVSEITHRVRREKRTP